MIKKQTKKTTSLERLGFILLIAIGFNTYFVFVFNKSVTTRNSFYLFCAIVLFNLIYFVVTIPIFGFNEVEEKPSISSIDRLLSKLEYLSPTKVETIESIQNETEDVIVDIIEDKITPIETMVGDTIQILYPKQVITTKKTYNKAIHMDQYANLLHHYLMDYGLKVDPSNIKSIFGAMAATRLIIIKTNHQAISRRFISLFSDFLGANFQELLIKHNYHNFNDFISENETVRTHLLEASNDKNKINVLSFTDVDLNDFETYADVFIDYALNTTLNRTTKEPLSSIISELPSNLWFMIVSNDQNTTPKNKMIETAFTVTLNASIITPKEVVHENGLKLSYGAFQEHLRESYDICYLDEPYWKKIDQLEDYIKTYSPFEIDNRIVLQLERFCALYLLSGGDSKDCIDVMLSTKLLIMIGGLNMTKKENDETSFLAIIEKLFGLENLSQSKALIKKIEHSFTLEREEV